MISDIRPIDSAASMIAAIRQAGIIPLFRNTVPGWSIQELTGDGYWFADEEDGGSLGPWDWKIDAIREGDILYGKFISNKAAFATPEWYRHLMNWRRSLPRMRMALGEVFEVRNQTDRLAKSLSPVLLSEIRKSRSMESARIRTVLSGMIPDGIRTKVACDSVVQYLEMGTWVVVGDFERVYRGENLEYKGWQRSTLTTPEEILGAEPLDESVPAWAKSFMEDTGVLTPTETDCSPAESLEILTDHIVYLTGCQSRQSVQKFLTAHT